MVRTTDREKTENKFGIIVYLQSDFATCHLYNQFHKTNMTWLLKLMTWLPEKYDMDNFI